MSTVTRFVLLPEDEYKRFQIPVTKNNYEKVKSECDDDDKINFIKDETKKVENSFKTEETKFVPIDELKDEILKSVAVSYRYKAIALFQFIKENPSFLRMTMLGEAVIEGKRIPSSSVHQLLHVLFRNRRKIATTPVGLEELMEALAKTEFPIEHIVNQRLKSVLRTLRADQSESLYKDELSEQELRSLIELLIE